MEIKETTFNSKSPIIVKSHQVTGNGNNRFYDIGKEFPERSCNTCVRPYECNEGSPKDIGSRCLNWTFQSPSLECPVLVDNAVLTREI